MKIKLSSLVFLMGSKTEEEFLLLTLEKQFK